jgi:hypothetical protein
MRWGNSGEPRGGDGGGPWGGSGGGVLGGARRRRGSAWSAPAAGFARGGRRRDLRGEDGAGCSRAQIEWIREPRVVGL